MLQNPIFNKYRPIFDFAGARTKISGSVELVKMENILPGTSGLAEITFISGVISDSYFKAGEAFTISEGGRYILGKGEILEILS